jgi:hypothetical protein
MQEKEWHCGLINTYGIHSKFYYLLKEVVQFYHVAPSQAEQITVPAQEHSFCEIATWPQIVGAWHKHGVVAGDAELRLPELMGLR